jgi:hypothetical protein
MPASGSTSRKANMNRITERLGALGIAAVFALATGCAAEDVADENEGNESAKVGVVSQPATAYVFTVQCGGHTAGGCNGGRDCAALINACEDAYGSGRICTGGECASF